MITFSKFGNYGRLGNQMFQYATLKSLSLRKNYNLFLPLTENNKLAQSFNIRCHLFNDSRALQQISSTFKEKQFNYDPDVFQVKDGTDFEGYFQTEKYFKEIKYILQREFVPRNESVTKKAKEVIDNIKKENDGKEIVAFHIRRGDNVPSQKNFSTQEGAQFLTNKEDFHPLLSKEFIEQAPKNFNNCVYIVFSDTQEDMKWCKENVKIEKAYFLGGNSDLFDFELMKYCDHNIISNSSFSWWAAWLNDNEQKTVVAPSKWFGKAYAHHNLVDLIPKSWKVI